MGKYVVTGLHSSGKSAFIRSFARNEDAKLLKSISQAQRSTRFIAEYCFKDDTALQIKATFKSQESVEDEIIENLRRRIMPEESQNDEFAVSQLLPNEKEQKKEKKEQELLKEYLNENLKSDEDWSEVIKLVFDLGKSKFIDMNEFVPRLLETDEYEKIKDDLKIGKKTSELSVSDIKNLVGGIYKECLSKIEGLDTTNTITIKKGCRILWSKDQTTDSVNENDEAFKTNIKMLFCVPKSNYDKIPYFSGIVKKATITLGLNSELMDDKNCAKYSFMAGQKGEVDFTLFDSFGLDHGAHDSGYGDDNAQNVIINAYKYIISQPGINGVILLGTLSKDVEDSQSAGQSEIVPYIVSYNLSEKPGLNVIFILNHADETDEYSSKENRLGIIDDVKKRYEAIKDSAEIKALKSRFQEDYIVSSIDNFLDSVCIYSASPSTPDPEIENMNIETYEKIDRICRTFNRYGISWNDELPDDLGRNATRNYISAISDYFNSSIKIISAKKKISKDGDDNIEDINDDNNDYQTLSNRYDCLIRWNTAEALANQWNKKHFDSYSYAYTGKALCIGCYGDEERKIFEIDQHPENTLKKHMIAMFNCLCRQNPYYPYNGSPFKESMSEGNGNRVIFIQKCMYDAIFEFICKEKTKVFLNERIRTLLQKQPDSTINRYDLEAMNNQRQDNLSDYEEIAESFQELFEEKVTSNYKKFHKLAIDDAIRNLLLNVLDEKRVQYENAAIKELLKAVICEVSPGSLAELELPVVLRLRLREMIDEMQGNLI